VAEFLCPRTDTAAAADVVGYLRLFSETQEPFLLAVPGDAHPPVKDYKTFILASLICHASVRKCRLWRAGSISNLAREMSLIKNELETETNMRTPCCRTIGIVISIIALAGLATGCSSMKSGGGEKDVTLEQMSAPARATVNKETAGGHVDKITKEVERGKTVYDVEATVVGKHMEYLIADADGTLLGTEVPIPFEELPEPVRAATQKYFGTTTGLLVMKGVEYGETHYEIEGPKNGKKVEVTFDPAGKPAK
jgi:uncharacterized membrane protein YkoI